MTRSGRLRLVRNRGRTEPPPPFLLPPAGPRRVRFSSELRRAGEMVPDPAP